MGLHRHLFVTTAPDGAGVQHVAANKARLAARYLPYILRDPVSLLASKRVIQPRGHLLLASSIEGKQTLFYLHHAPCVVSPHPFRARKFPSLKDLRATKSFPTPLLFSWYQCWCSTRVFYSTMLRPCPLASIMWSSLSRCGTAGGVAGDDHRGLFQSLLTCHRQDHCVQDSRDNYRSILKMKEEGICQCQVTGTSAMTWALKEMSSFEAEIRPEGQSPYHVKLLSAARVSFPLASFQALKKMTKSVLVSRVRLMYRD